MIHVTPRLRAFPIALALVAGASCWATASVAQTAPVPPAPAASGDSIRLTDEQRMAILDSNTVESAAAARGELPESRYGDRRIHGEIGAMIGTNGTRGIYGVAEIPLGDRASAVLSFENSRYGYRR